MDEWTKPAVAADVIKSPNDLIFANGKYWAVGGQGRMQYSANGIDWTVYTTPATDHLTSIAYGNGRYVAVGYQATIMSSANGVDWTVHEQDTSSGFEAWRQVSFINGQFIVVGRQGQVRLSSNGTDWKSTTMSGANFYPSQVAWGNGLYVAVGEFDGVRNVQTSPDAVTWTPRTTLSGILESVAFFNGLFVASAESLLATSPDGVTWTKVTGIAFPYSNVTIFGLKVLNGRLFAFGEYGTLLSSTNGTDWVKHTTDTTYAISSLDYNGERLLSIRSGVLSNSGGPAYSAPWAPVAAPAEPQPPAPGSPGNPEDPSEPSTPGEPADPVDSDAPAASSQMVNLSTRSWVGTDHNLMIAGFVVQGTAPKTVLVRAVGPALAQFGVAAVLADPQLRVMNAQGVEIAANDDWGTAANHAETATTAAAVGAFPLAEGSRDAAMLVTLQPGIYTVLITGAGNSSGIALAEVYDCEPGATSRLINISSRTQVGSGEAVAIAGFVVTGSGSRDVLVRGIGPSLAAFGVPGVIANPKIALYNASGQLVAENDDWGTAPDVALLTETMGEVGAFALPVGSTDAAMIITVEPGLYTVIVSGVGDATGLGLLELYDLP